MQRLCALHWPHEKRGPDREIAELERREVPASRKREANGRPIAPSGAPVPSLCEAGKNNAPDGRKPGRGADGVCLKGGQMRALGSAALQHTRHARTRAGHDEWRGFVLEYPPTR